VELPYARRRAKVRRKTHHDLRAGLCVSDQKEFCKSSGCPPERLEWWLKEKWIQHNIHKVEHLEEKTGTFPLILISRDPDAGPCWCTIRLFSVKPGIGTPPAPTKQWKN